LHGPKPEQQASPLKRFLWPFIRPHRRVIILAVIMNAFSGIAISIQTVTPKYFIDDILLNSALDNAAKMKWAMILAAAFLVTTIIWRMLLWHLSYRMFTRVREQVVRSLRSAFFRHINSLCLRFHVRHHSGELFSYLFGTPLLQVQTYFQQLTMMGPHCAFCAISTIVVVMFWDPWVSATMVVAVAASTWVMGYSRQRVKTLSAEFQERERHVSGRVADMLRGTRHVKMYAIEDDVFKQFQVEADTMSRQTVQRDVRSHELWMTYEGVGYVGFSLLCVVSAWRYLSGDVKIGEISAYLSAYAALSWPLNILFQISQARGGAQASLERMAEVMDTISTTPEPDDADRVAPPANAPIELRNVTFRYTDSDVINDLSLTIPYGQTVALVGHSGSGKSTLSQLILRLYDPREGEVRIGNVDLKTCSGTDVRRLFGIVPQQPFFFRASVLDNVRLLKPGATEDEVWHSLELAHAASFVRELESGVHTIIAEEGSTLSGGQRQRLAIARALLASPSYFIFDEATSALDTVSEKAIQETLRKILPGRTAIIIAHRLATIRDCKRILVMQSGRIVQDGTYADLAAADGPFAEMARQNQFDGVST
jgi:ABC-type multidrug transport system fused ATPase/permease subunit